jgi:hypothetical protein
MSDLTEEPGLSEEFYALTHANLVLNYELAGEPGSNQEARERCAPVYRAYMAKAKELVRGARDSLLRLEALPDEARAMDTECEARLAKAIDRALREVLDFIASRCGGNASEAEGDAWPGARLGRSREAGRCLIG